ncbi:GntR family transcriptional regulator [Kribbella sp. NPDC026611]|uniref:GntR family transcriptional regulator n=1 Tax=Kribbella sp. NPDC026611 TaxID=3154911 RepID=UPI0033D0162A
MSGFEVTPRILRDQVLEQVEEAIVSGDLKPGDRINEVLLAAQMNVSRGTLREALRSFEQAGLLVSKPNRGTYVRVIAPEDTVEVFELMGIVEGRAVRRAIELRGPDLQAVASTHLERMAEVLTDKSSTPRTRQDADLAMHEAICACAGSEFLIDTWRRQKGMVLSVVANVGQPVITQVQAAESHQELVDAIATGDPDEAERVFQKHWRDAAEAITSAMSTAAGRTVS